MFNNPASIRSPLLPSFGLLSLVARDAVAVFGSGNIRKNLMQFVMEIHEISPCDQRLLPHVEQSSSYIVP